MDPIWPEVSLTEISDSLHVITEGFPRFWDRPLINESPLAVSKNIPDFSLADPLKSEFLFRNDFLSKMLGESFFLKNITQTPHLWQSKRQIFWDIGRSLTEEDKTRIDERLSEYPVLENFILYYCAAMKKNKFYSEWTPRSQKQLGERDVDMDDLNGLKLAYYTWLRQVEELPSEVQISFKRPDEFHEEVFERHYPSSEPFLEKFSNVSYC